MASNQAWITNKGGSWRAESSMNSKVVMTWSQVSDLATALNKPTVSTLLFGDFTKWCTSLMYYPIIFKDPTSTKYKLRAGGIDYDTTCLGRIPAEDFGIFTLGEKAYPKAKSYLDFEPYSKAEIYLPYYGFVPLKIADVEGKYIQIRLSVDYNTGQAQYIVGVNPHFVATGNDYPQTTGMDDSETRILGIYNLQLGVSVPLSVANFGDTMISTAVSVGKAAATIGSSFATDAMPTRSFSSTAKTATTERNPNTGRQITKGTNTKSYESVSHVYGGKERVNTAIDTAATVLSGLNYSTAGLASNNGSLNNNLCPSVKIVITKAVPTLDRETDDSYKHLVGLPVGACKKLGACVGYTEVTDVHLEGNLFGIATSEEMSMLYDEILGGIIL